MPGVKKPVRAFIGNAAITSLWNQPEYSDITIKFAGKSIYCHKFVLCRASDYFKKQFGPGSRFAESNLKEVELKDDDPDALETMLRRLYQLDYSSSKPWQFHLAVMVVANKYLLTDLWQLANSRFRTAASSLTAIAEVVLVLRALDTGYDGDVHMTKFRDFLHEDKLDDLLRCDEYRAYLQERPELLWRDLDELVKSRPAGVKTRECTAHVCGYHKNALESGVIYPAAETKIATPGSPTPSNMCAFRNPCSGGPALTITYPSRYFVPRR